MIAEKFGYLSGVFDVALYAERHGLDTLKKQKAIERRHRGASVSLGYSAATGDECGSAVMFDVNDAVISGLRTGEHVIAVGIIAPGEFSAVNDHSANRSSVAAHELGHGMDDDIGAVLDGAKQDWRCHGVVDDQRHAVLVGNSCEPLDVRDVSGRIPYAFAEYGSGIFVDQFLDILGAIALRKTARDPLFRKNVLEQRVSGAVQLRERNNVVAGFRDVHERVVDGSHPRTDTQALHAAFERGNAFLEDCVGGIADAGIDVPLNFEIEQRSAMLRAIKLEGNRLINGHRYGFGYGVTVVTNMNCNRLSLHQMLSRSVSPDLRILGDLGSGGGGNISGIAGERFGNVLCDATCGESCTVSETHQGAEAVRSGNSDEVESWQRRFKTGGKRGCVFNGLDVGANVVAEEVQALEIYAVTGGDNHVIHRNLASAAVASAERQANLVVLDLRAFDRVTKHERHASFDHFLREPSSCRAQVRFHQLQPGILRQKVHSKGPVATEARFQAGAKA